MEPQIPKNFPRPRAEVVQTERNAEKSSQTELSNRTGLLRLSKCVVVAIAHFTHNRGVEENHDVPEAGDLLWPGAEVVRTDRVKEKRRIIIR